MADRVLVVAAHPDDEVLGCGGTLARLAREGHETYVGILGEGITSRHAAGDPPPPGAVDALHATARKAADRLGARDFFSHRLPDNRFDTVPLLEVVRVVEDWVARCRPAALYTHHAGDVNVDHVLTHRAVLTATRPISGCPVREVFAFEIHSSTEWAFSQFAPFRPNVFVDIGDTLDDKIAALRLYEGEVRPFPHPRSPEALRASAQRWGAAAGVSAAEAFELVRWVR
jgi:LmbE family N-acetylglucosaminyl deacetylase